MIAGETFLVPDMDDHMWMVVSDPSLNPQKVVIVCFLSWREHYDKACVVQAGEHPFVQHTTCVNYPGARLATDTRLESLRVAGKLKTKTPLSPDLLNRIRQCAENSDIPTESYEVLREQGFVG